MTLQLFRSWIQVFFGAVTKISWFRVQKIALEKVLNQAAEKNRIEEVNSGYNIPQNSYFCGETLARYYSLLPLFALQSMMHTETTVQQTATLPAPEDTLRYRITHKTRYDYQNFVNISHNQALLTPRSFQTPLLEQRLLTSSLEISPRPDDERPHSDFYGNTVHYFALQKPHKHLHVSATSFVERRSYTPRNDRFLSESFAWEDVTMLLRRPRTALADAFAYKQALEASEFLFPSGMVVFRDDFARELTDYTLQSFTPKRPVLEAARELVGRIHQDCQFMPGFTSISTPIETVFRERKGVCQDFAHLALGCLRSVGLAARYVSGYIETFPPEGAERLIGADASHAWISVFTPHLGWVDFDPTNNQLVRSQHITLGWGRDYADVPPLKGVLLGTGATELSVSVDVVRV